MEKYKLLDCGGGKKLEQVGEYIIIRPAPQAIWECVNRNVWENVDAEFVRTTGEYGVWNSIGKKLPKSWWVENQQGTKFNIEPNDFGNIGVFAEHWSYTKLLIKEFDMAEPILNLFTYSGSSCVGLAKLGYKIVAVDSSKSSMNLYTQNLEKNGVDRSGHKLILEDCYKFMQREIRRGRKYSSIMMDAPSFGRGTKGEVFSIEDDFYKIVLAAKELLSNKGKMIITNHSPRFTPKMLEIFIGQIFNNKKVSVSEILQKCDSGLELPSGFLVFIS